MGRHKCIRYQRYPQDPAISHKKKHWHYGEYMSAITVIE